MVDANDKNIYVKLAAVFFEVGDINQFLSNLQKARDIDPEDLDIRLKMARDFAMVRKTAESRQELDFILEKDPQHLGCADAFCLSLRQSRRKSRTRFHD